MAYYHKIFIIMMLINNSKLSDRNTCGTSSHFQLLANNSRADVAAILSDFAQSFSICAHLCLAHKLCTSFNYNDRMKRCEILSFIHIHNQKHKLVSSLGWSFYQKAAEQTHGKCLDCADWQTSAVATDGSQYKCIELDNIALRKPTRQSSTCYKGVSSRAVDGNTETKFRFGNESGSCTYTCLETTMWWMVDFGQTALVQSINITNRVGKRGIRLSNFNIKIGESAEGQGDANALCVSNADVAAGATKTFKCASTLTGRYLYIKTNLQDILTLCEVKVFGEFL